MKNIAHLFFVTTLFLNYCFASEKRLVRKINLDPNILNASKRIEIYGVDMDHQDDGILRKYFRSAQLEDHSCMFRAYKAAEILLNDENKDEINIQKLQSKTLADFFSDKLRFDSFVYPQIFSGICKNAPQKIIYYNFSIKRLPIAGQPMMNKEENLDFCAFKEIIKKNIVDKEKLDLTSKDNEINRTALCFGSDYKDLLLHIRNMNANDSYQFGVVSTKFGGEVGHAITIVVRKESQEKPIQLICMDGGNIISYRADYFSEMISQLSEIIVNPELLETRIVRYLYAVEPFNIATIITKELGLQNNEVYKKYYSLSGLDEDYSVHNAFRQAQLWLEQLTGFASIGDEANLFLNSLRDCGPECDPSIYTLVCENANSETNLVLNINNSNDRKNLKEIASRIVYLKRIVSQRLFDKDSQYKKLLNLQDLR